MMRRSIIWLRRPTLRLVTGSGKSEASAALQGASSTHSFCRPATSLRYLATGDRPRSLLRHPSLVAKKHMDGGALSTQPSSPAKPNPGRGGDGERHGALEHTSYDPAETARPSTLVIWPYYVVAVNRDAQRSTCISLTTRRQGEIIPQFGRRGIGETRV